MAPPLDPSFLTQALCCPDDGGSPLLRDGDSLICPLCRREFQVTEGIVSMLPSAIPDEAGAADVEAERHQRDREATRYDRLLALRLLSLAEIPATLRPLRLEPSDRVVDVGCGTGRMTMPLAGLTDALIALDHSLDSLRVLRRKLDPQAAHRVLLVQADATRLPVCSAWATCAVSSQMLEHLPTGRMRSGAIAEIARVLEPDGRLALTAYWYAPLLRHFLAQEGRHSGEIFFHRFTRDELAALLTSHFQIDQLTGGLLYVLLAHCRKKR